jgi:hypothetical protein
MSQQCEPKPLPYDPPVGPNQSPKPTNHGPSGGQQGRH